MTVEKFVRVYLCHLTGKKAHLCESLSHTAMETYIHEMAEVSQFNKYKMYCGPGRECMQQL